MEGDELVEYVLVSLPANVDLSPGSTIKLMDLSTDKPKIQLVDGSDLEGCYEESIGTIMLYTSAQVQQPIKFLGLTETKLSLHPTLPSSNLS